MPPFSTPTLRFGFTLMTMACLLLSCDSEPGSPKAPPLPENLAQPVDAGGTRFQALAYADRQQSAALFGFDILGSGLLPVRVSIDNRSGATIKIIPRQTFLIDVEGQAWPLLTTDQAYKRLQSGDILQDKSTTMTAPDGMESLTGFALDMVVSANFSATAPVYARTDTPMGNHQQEMNFRNPKVPTGKIASGVLFFAAREEASGTRYLRLCIEQDGRLQFVKLPLKAALP